MTILPHQPKSSHSHVHGPWNQIAENLPCHLKDSEQKQRQIEPHSAQNSYCLCHTTQAHKQTSPKRPCTHQNQL